jgi:hypothetical protein
MTENSHDSQLLSVEELMAEMSSGSISLTSPTKPADVDGLREELDMTPTTAMAINCMEMDSMAMGIGMEMNIDLNSSLIDFGMDASKVTGQINTGTLVGSLSPGGVENIQPNENKASAKNKRRKRPQSSKIGNCTKRAKSLHIPCSNTNDIVFDTNTPRDIISLFDSPMMTSIEDEYFQSENTSRCKRSVVAKRAAASKKSKRDIGVGTRSDAEHFGANKMLQASSSIPITKQSIFGDAGKSSIHKKERKKKISHGMQTLSGDKASTPACESNVGQPTATCSQNTNNSITTSNDLNSSVGNVSSASSSNSVDRCSNAGVVERAPDGRLVVRRGPRGKYSCGRCGSTKKEGHVCRCVIPMLA